MALTAVQYATLGAALRADSTIALARSTGDLGAIVAYCNAVPPSPTMLWRPSITVADLNTAIDWTVYPLLNSVQREVYRDVTTPGFIDATSPNIRVAFTVVFPSLGVPAYTGGPNGTALTAAVQAALVAKAQVAATRFQALFSTSQVSAVFGQSVTVADVVIALAS